jgi:hypothetical protein
MIRSGKFASFAQEILHVVLAETCTARMMLLVLHRMRQLNLLKTLGAVAVFAKEW